MTPRTPLRPRRPLEALHTTSGSEAHGAGSPWQDSGSVTRVYFLAEVAELSSAPTKCHLSPPLSQGSTSLRVKAKRERSAVIEKEKDCQLLNQSRASDSSLGKTPGAGWG